MRTQPSESTEGDSWGLEEIREPRGVGPGSSASMLWPRCFVVLVGFLTVGGGGH